MLITPQHLAFIGILLLGSVLDIKYRMLPDSLSLGVVLLSLPTFQLHTLWGILPALFLFYISYRTDKFGGGDVKLIGACGLYFGLGRNCASLFLGFTAFSLFYALYAFIHFLRNTKGKDSFPLVPFLSMGYLTTLFFY